MSGTLLEVLFIFVIFGVLIWAAPKLNMGEPVRVLLIIVMVVLLALVLLRGPLLVMGLLPGPLLI